MIAKPVAFLLADLGVSKSHSRPHVSNDNPFSESQFRTMKYRPEFPERLGCYADAKAFCGRFPDWYNDDHRSLRHRVPHPYRRPLRASRKRQITEGRRPQRGLRRAPRTLRPQATRTTGTADGGLDQRAGGGCPFDTVILLTICLKRVDTRRSLDLLVDSLQGVGAPDLPPWAEGKLAKEQMSGAASRSIASTAGNWRPSLPAIESSWSATAAASGWAKMVRMAAATISAD